MRGYHNVYFWCPCGHGGKVRERPEWQGLTRDQIFPKLRCSKCGGRPNDMRYVWHVESGSETAGSESG